MRRLIPLLLAALAFAETTATFKTRLAPVAMDQAMRLNIGGQGKVTAVLTGSTLKISGTFEGLVSPATVAQVHSCQVTATRGPVLFDLTVEKATKGPISGSHELTPEQIEMLRKGRLYVQLDSEKAPDGNLWGWLMP